ncbi:hypothetical protein MUN88_12135 [Gracilibacillus caseinilyticus]|uniref:DUF2007 domain-containing protein n=1 Tax=Gracilibacillus caseinilyticus TaxID=2932256 RepID=A0ABY4ETA0_9BACI|nr:hypothetical protein [Gracilibacillus caseinilyticus]UOQ46844.1 hypothetical protein MUN88_12135 [Gracilibacillus caseinilyticus]
MRLFRKFFSKYKHLAYTAFENEKYLEVVSKLKQDGVKFRTEIIRSLHTSEVIGHHDNAQYEIYVKESDKHKAQAAIHK